MANTVTEKGERQLVIDGTGEDGCWEGDARRGPYVVFDVNQQQNVTPVYRWRWQAKRARRRLLKTGLERLL